MSSEKLGVRDGVRSGRRLVANPGAWRGWHLGKLGRSKQRPYPGLRLKALLETGSACPASTISWSVCEFLQAF